MIRMNFADWFKADHLWEFHDIKDMPTDNIELIRGDSEEFDEQQAEYDCEEDSQDMDFGEGCYDGIYEDPTDDPDFEALRVEDWEEDNPEPIQANFESEEEYQQAQEEWDEQRADVERAYDDEVASWERNMSRMRNSAEECESEARWDWVRDCVRDKEREHENNNDGNEGDLHYKFTIDNDEYQVNFSSNDPIRIGRNYIDKVWGITFEGPQGFSTTNKGKSSLVYTQMLLACKKLMEQEQPNVLQFTPAEPAMGLVYQKFVQMFLSGTFIQTNYGNYVRKKALMEAIKDESPEFKRDIYGKIMDSHREVLDKENAVREEKNRQREGFQKARSMIGSLAAVKIQVGYGDQYEYMPAVVLSAQFASGKGTALILSLDRYNGAVREQQQNATTVLPVQDAASDANFRARIKTFVEYIIRYPALASKLGQKALQELRSLVPDLADQLQQAMTKQEPPGPFDGPKPPQSQGFSGWDRV